MSMRDLIPWGRQESRSLDPYPEPARSPFLSLRREMDRLFDDFFGASMTGSAGFGAAWPRIEVKEGDDALHVTAELPGLSEEDVELLLDEDRLTLRGEKKSEVEDKDRGYTERSYGRFERRVGLPRGVERDKASATFQNGVLTITLPKSEAANENVRRIPVNAQAA